MRQQFGRRRRNLTRWLAGDGREQCVVCTRVVKVPVLMQVAAENLGEIRATVRRSVGHKRIVPARRRQCPLPIGRSVCTNPTHLAVVNLGGWRLDG